MLEATGRIAFARVAEDPDDLSSLTREQIGTLSIQRAALGDLGGYLGMKRERVEHSGPGGGPVQVDLLVSMLLTPANLERLDDAEVAAIRSAAAKLALPAPVIDVTAEAVAVAASGARGDVAGEPDDAEPTDTAAEV